MKLDFLEEFEFFAGVPDSQLRPLCDYLMNSCGIGRKHLIAANEGNAVALAAGYHLATGKVPVVYLQNSGIGNIINPVASLMNEKVYGIPCLFIVGWRGEPGVHDEPQHIFQGEVTLKLLEDMGIHSFVISKETTDREVAVALEEFRTLFAEGRQAAFVVRKGALEYGGKVRYHNDNLLLREEVIRHVLQFSGDDVIVSTTGKASRELFELRENAKQDHGRDFLTVGSMGHSSSIALGIALQKPDKRVWIVDGDGALLMHMGAMATLGTSGCKNIIHLVINNSAHESVGGMPTVAGRLDLAEIAGGCGYAHVLCANSIETLDAALEKAVAQPGPVFLEVKSAIGAREDLGRPTKTAKENKKHFMETLGK